MSQTEVVIPCVHMNGTSADELIRLRCDVIEKLHEAYEALKQMGPNGRDYYPEPGKMDRAIEQHRRRQLAVDALIAELNQEAESIQELGSR